MAKDLGGFLNAFKGNLASGLGQMSGLGQIGGPMSGIGLLKQLMGGGDNGAEGPDGEDNPGRRMFEGRHGGAESPGYLQKFGGNLSDQLFKNAMMGFMRPWS